MRFLQSFRDRNLLGALIQAGPACCAVINRDLHIVLIPLVNSLAVVPHPISAGFVINLEDHWDIDATGARLAVGASGAIQVGCLIKAGQLFFYSRFFFSSHGDGV